MKADFLELLEYWERERKIPRQTLVEGLKTALVQAAKRAVSRGRKLECEINLEKKEFNLYSTLIVVENVRSKHDEISIAEARKINPDVKIGDEIKVEVTPSELGRIASKIAEEAFKRAVRQAEKEKIQEEYTPYIGHIIAGKVIRFEQSDVILDLGNCEAVLPQGERVRSETFQKGDTIRCLLKKIEPKQSGPLLILSRADVDFVKALFRLEVSEIKENIIEIKAIAREPGVRTKIAVFSKNPKVDPVGACVGLQGSRVKNIVKELNNEKVDIVHWSPDTKTFIANALAPAKIKSIEIDEEHKRAYVIVSKDQQFVAIGKNGQNAKLTSKLCGYEIKIEAEKEVRVDKSFEEQKEHAIEELAKIEGVSREQATVLVNNGITNLESLLSIDVSDLAEIEGIGQETAKAIMEAAKKEAEKRKITLDIR